MYKIQERKYMESKKKKMHITEIYVIMYIKLIISL